ncbi:hypothetical protein BCR34DRAFT_619709 [Clohesyomyces aquaticus]|uniref:DUF7580 domain-containing protein n=1 Tax=Clohesyomyces aquaticus TaxID=1231657 RepID=A0A1Y1YEG6_9PLEO|nr:hypothetical protein BCR34DRAFT_619709 [Clohesyomyces aquaticus]
MSGFELAGAVLGALPLVISALEHYKDGLAVMKNMRDYEDVFNDIQSQFGASVSIYMNSCYQLLGPLNLPDQQVIQLLEQQPTKVNWSDKQLQRGIERRLGPNYKAYISLTEKLNKRIKLFCKKLKLNDDLKPLWVEPDGVVDEKARKKFFKRTWTKIRGGFSSAKYSSLLQEIDRDIDKIAKLISGAIQLEPLGAGKRNRLYSTYSLRVRNQAQKLFEIEDQVTRLALLLTFGASECLPNALPWTWRDIEIVSSQPLTQQIIVPTPTPGGAFGNTAHTIPSVTISPTPSSVASFPSQPPTARIDNLCEALVDVSGLECCLGIIEDQHWHHHVYVVTGPGSKNQISESASLEEIICQRKMIATRQKCTLALTLAISVLQLHGTPWLPEVWGIKDIFILQGHTGDLLPSAYVSRTFSSPSAEQAAAKRRRCVKNEQVFALGVALLELAYGSPLHSHITPDDLGDDGKQDSMTEVAIAFRLTDRIEKLENENYSKAVQRCIHFQFGCSCFDFEDNEFRERFFEGVVMPLQENWEFMTGAKL